MEAKSELSKLAVELYDVGAINYGNFITKVGLKTPIYIDLRVIISYPPLLERISKMLWSLMDNTCTHVCGVPYTALPIATVISTANNVPIIIRRKESKSYGTKKMIEGVFRSGDTAVIVEDIITSGSSVLETVQDLQKEGLKASIALVIVDREQGGKKNLESVGIRVKSLFKITDLIEYLFRAGRLSEESVKVVTEYIRTIQAPIKTDKNDIAEIAGPHIAVLKTHIDILEDFDKSFIVELKRLAIKYNFLIMEDRKFADIGHVVSHQLRHGLYTIAKWADLITIHAIPGSGIIDGIANGFSGINEPKGIFIVVEMSSKDTLTNTEYTNAATAMVKDNQLVAGFVCQKNVFEDPGLVQLTPGVKLVKDTDSLGQQYNSPADVVKSGADLIVVGRGITQADDKLQAILEYKQVLFDAYKSRVH